MYIHDQYNTGALNLTSSTDFLSEIILSSPMVSSSPVLQAPEQHILEKSANSDSDTLESVRAVQSKYFGNSDSGECGSDASQSVAKTHGVNNQQSESAHDDDSRASTHGHTTEKRAAQQSDANKDHDHIRQREAVVNSARHPQELHAPQESAHAQSAADTSSRAEHAHAQSNEAAAPSLQVEATMPVKPVDAPAASKPGGFLPEMFTVAQHPQPPHVPTSAHVPQASGDQSKSIYHTHIHTHTHIILCLHACKLTSSF
jgi:hypothetical protein